MTDPRARTFVIEGRTVRLAPHVESISYEDGGYTVWLTPGRYATVDALIRDGYLIEDHDREE